MRILIIIIIIVVSSILVAGLAIVLIPTIVHFEMAPLPPPIEYLDYKGVLVLGGANDVHTVTIDSKTYAIAASSLDHGIQIINITNPEVPTPISNLTDDTTLVLQSIDDVHTVTIDSKTYAIAASYQENSIQIIDITNPEVPTPVSNLTDDTTLVLQSIDDVHTVTIDSKTYAIAASSLDHGIQIINITNPEVPTPVSRITDDTTLVLQGANGVHTTTIDSNTYAIAASYQENGIQIIDITNPEVPTPVSNLTDDTTLVLQGANGVHTTTIDSNTYAIVTARQENGIQIIDITNPEVPTPVSNIAYDATFILGEVLDIHTTTINSNTYAIVAAYFLQSHIQIINITNPEVPTPVSNLTDDTTLLLSGARGVHTTTINSNTYAIVANPLDHGIQIINITNPEMPTPVSRIKSIAPYPDGKPDWVL